MTKHFSSYQNKMCKNKKCKKIFKPLTANQLHCSTACKKESRNESTLKYLKKIVSNSHKWENYQKSLSK